jgi:hypothetical protein
LFEVFKVCRTLAQIGHVLGGFPVGAGASVEVGEINDDAVSVNRLRPRERGFVAGGVGLSQDAAPSPPEFFKHGGRERFACAREADDAHLVGNVARPREQQSGKGVCLAFTYQDGATVAGYHVGETGRRVGVGAEGLTFERVRFARPRFTVEAAGLCALSVGIGEDPSAMRFATVFHAGEAEQATVSGEFEAGERRPVARGPGLPLAWAVGG